MGSAALFHVDGGKSNVIKPPEMKNKGGKVRKGVNGTRGEGFSRRFILHFQEIYRLY